MGGVGRPVQRNAAHHTDGDPMSRRRHLMLRQHRATVCSVGISEDICLSPMLLRLHVQFHVDPNAYRKAGRVIVGELFTFMERLTL